jgi:hypothetical protein
MMRLSNLFVGLSLLWAMNAFSQDRPPDLSGVWRGNTQKSKSSFPANEMRLKIEQHGPDLLVTWRMLSGPQELMQTSYCRIGSDDSRNMGLLGIPIKNSTKWQGSSLEIDSASVASGAAPSRELWTLSKDGQTLVFKGHHPEASAHSDERSGESVAGQKNEESIVFEKQTDETWGPPQKILPATAVYQNIQVIREPAWRIPTGMMSLTRWLGVDCSFCHTLNEFEKDDKEPKKIARQMFKMVHDINEANFPGTEPGNFKVTCWTCHRGSIIPETNQPVVSAKPTGR